MARSLEELREYLVGEWLLDNNFKDSSGNGNHGVPTDIEWKPTARGLKPYFNGSSSFINTNITTLQNNFTYSAWFMPNTTNTFNPIFGTSPYWDGFWIYYHGSLGLIRGEFNGVTEYTSSAIGIDTTQFNHLALTYNNSSISIFINGEHVNDVDASGDVVSSLDVLIGCARGSYRMLGYIDHAQIYTTPLVADEVLALYNSTKNAVGVRPAERSYTHRLQPEVDANTVAAFDMSTKNSDGTLMDLSW